MKPISRICLTLLLVTAAALLLGGCSGYQLGAGAKLPFNSVYVAPVINRSLAPQAQALLTDQTMMRLIEGGRVKVEGKGAAQATLTITLTGFNRSLAISQASDTQLARAFDLELVAQITLTDSRSGVIYIDKQELRARQQVFGNSSEALAERNAMPELTAKLALAITDAVEGVW